MELNEKQLQILEIAEKLFAEHGFDGTSVRQIAKEADINIAMISYYFGSKEKLLDTLLSYRSSDFRAELTIIIENGQLEHFEKIDIMVNLLVKRIHKNRRIHKIVNFEYTNGCRTANIQKFLEHKKKNYLLIENFIKDGQEKNVFTKTVNIPMIVPTILGTYFHFYYNKNFFKHLHNLSEKDIENYVQTDLTNHIQTTIKAILTYEK